VTNRAQRFVEDGPGESMFRMIVADVELSAHPDREGPVLPSLRARDEATQLGVVHRPLFDRAEGFPELPVIVYVRDTPTAVALMRATGDEDVAQLHAEALRNLTTQEASVEWVEGEGPLMAVVSDSFYAAEKLLDPAFLRSLHTRLGGLIAVAVPRRGLLLATAATVVQGILALRTIAEHEATGSRRISPSVVLVQDGEIIGLARVGDPPAAPAAPAKKPGWLRRVFGRN
jgi:hypothetical protein